MTFAEIFRLSLIVLTLLGCAASLIKIGRNHKQEPLTHAISVIQSALIALGVWFLLEAKP